MPRDDAAHMLAGRLHSLRHPAGKVIRQMAFATTGLTPEVQTKVKDHALMTTQATIHELEREGYTLTHKDDPKPADAAGYKTVRVKCQLCGKELLALGVNEDMVATMPRLSLRQLTTVNPECPHD